MGTLAHIGRFLLGILALLLAGTLGQSGVAAEKGRLEEAAPEWTCYAALPGQSYAEAVAHYRAAGTVQPRFHLFDFSRWTETASDGPVADGRPLTLTWSLVPDGTINPDGGPASSLFADLVPRLPGADAAEREDFLRQLVRGTLDRWGELTGIAFVEEPNDDGALFRVTPGVLGVRGDIRIMMQSLPGGAAGVASGPNNGDIILATEAAGGYANPFQDFSFFLNLFGHEAGHSIGLDHTDPLDTTKLMEAVIATSVLDGPREDDIRGAQFEYGDAFEPNDTRAEAAALGALPPPAGSEPAPLRLPALALGDFETAEDWYSFSVPAGSALAASVAPVGTLYHEGEQGGPLSPTAARELRDLAFEILAPDGATTLATADSAGSGEREIVERRELTPGAGTYFVRVFSAAGSGLQRYELILDYLPVGTPVAAPVEIPPILNGFSLIPEDPRAAPSVTIFYDSTRTELGGSEEIFIRQGFNGDVPSTPQAMSFDAARRLWRHDVAVPGGGSSIDFVFQDAGRNFDENNRDDFQIRLDHVEATSARNPFELEGRLEAGAQLVDTNAGLSLYALFSGGWLYLATEAPQIGSPDRFLLFAEVPGAPRNAMFAKSGQVAAWDFFLGREGNNTFADWFSAAQGLVSQGGRLERHFVVGGFHEGAVNLEAVFGAPLPDRVFAAVATYQTPDGGSLLTQVPAAVVANEDIEAEEYAEIVLADVVLQEPLTAARHWQLFE